MALRAHRVLQLALAPAAARLALDVAVWERRVGRLLFADGAKRRYAAPR